MMRQIWIERHGPPEVLALREAAMPTPRAGEVQIQVVAAGMNFADIMARRGVYPDAPKPPCVVGYEVAGEVIALGEGVAQFAVGQRVVALTRFGGYASHVAVPQDQVFHLPAGLDPAQARRDAACRCPQRGAGGAGEGPDRWARRRSRARSHRRALLAAKL